MQWHESIYMHVTNSYKMLQACNGMYVCHKQFVIKCCKHAMVCTYIHACDKQFVIKCCKHAMACVYIHACDKQL